MKFWFQIWWTLRYKCLCLWIELYAGNSSIYFFLKLIHCCTVELTHLIASLNKVPPNRTTVANGTKWYWVTDNGHQTCRPGYRCVQQLWIGQKFPVQLSIISAAPHLVFLWLACVKCTDCANEKYSEFFPCEGKKETQYFLFSWYFKSTLWTSCSVRTIFVHLTVIYNEQFGNYAEPPVHAMN